jgi:sortase A
MHEKFLKYWLPPIVWGLVIFTFSSIQVGGTSEFYWTDFFIKKTAHIVEYAIFSILLHRAMINTGTEKKKAFKYAIFVAFLYGITDEIHQFFTPGRGPTARDVIIDAFGAYLGVLFVTTQNYLKVLGNILIFFSVLLLYLVFYPILKEETKYQINQVIQKEEEIVPPDKNYSIVIPKIKAVSRIVENVNPYNSKIFLNALKNGVAHAEGSSFPDKKGNVYLFAHSTDAFYNVGNYNATFYLLGKLEKDDEIKIYYKGNEYVYKTIEKKVVDKEDTSYLTRKTDNNLLTLQTCYPPGTTFRRLILIAKLDIK